MRYTHLIFLALLGLLLMGNTQCGSPTDDDGVKEPPDPDLVAEAIKISMDAAVGDIEAAEAVATLFEPPQFHPCMFADGSKGNIAGLKTWVDPIRDEAKDPDCEIELPGYDLDFSRCMDMEGKPDPWPPVDPVPEVEAAFTGAVPAVVSNIKLIVTLNQPSEGEACVQAEVWKAVLGDEDSTVQGAMTGIVLDAVNGSSETRVPGFKINYSGCGVQCGSDVVDTVLVMPIDPAEVLIPPDPVTE